MAAYILIDVTTGTIQAFASDGDPIAESRPHMQQMERPEWLANLFALCMATGIDHLEFLRGGQLEVKCARDFFSQRLLAAPVIADAPSRCRYCRGDETAVACECV